MRETPAPLAPIQVTPTYKQLLPFPFWGARSCREGTHGDRPPARKAGIPEHPQQQLPAAETTSALFLIIGLKIIKDAYMLRCIDGNPAQAQMLKITFSMSAAAATHRHPWPRGMDALCSIHRHHRAEPVVPEHE